MAFMVAVSKVHGGGVLGLVGGAWWMLHGSLRGGLEVWWEGKVAVWYRCFAW